jgi:hypothetical protein
MGLMKDIAGTIYLGKKNDILLTWNLHLGMISRIQLPWFQASGEQWGRDEIYPDICKA